jgi:hypothetical protein
MSTRYSHKLIAIFLLLSLAAFSAPEMRAADPGYIPQIAPDGTLINSPLLVNGNTVVTGQLSIDGGTGVITFAAGQTFPINLAGEVTGPWNATLVSSAVSPDTANAIVRRDSAGNFAANTISVDGDIALPKTTSSSVGVLTVGGTPFLHNFGTNNTFVGAAAGNMTMAGYGNSGFGAHTLPANTTGSYNAGFGLDALGSNTSGSNNTAFGGLALASITTASNNSAFGTAALVNNTTGASNSAFGFVALENNTTGVSNSAFGDHALRNNTVAQYNSAFGNNALAANTVGSGNSAFGMLALSASTTAGGNAAFGMQALASDTTGISNSAFGTGALAANATGGSNVAVGFDALNRLTVGNSNIAIGYGAGSGLTAGESNNIDIGNAGKSAESGVVRIGTFGVNTAAFIAGIAGTISPGGVPVFVNSGGQLGTITSSKRYKEQITDMDAESDVLMKLRPVSFYYKPEYDPMHIRQFGLVAEEVAKIAPDLVVFDQDGKPETVRYHFVNAMLLNEVQKLQRENQEQVGTIVQQQAQIQAVQTQLKELVLRLTAVEHSVQPGTKFASARSKVNHDSKEILHASMPLE